MVVPGNTSPAAFRKSDLHRLKRSQNFHLAVADLVMTGFNQRQPELPDLGADMGQIGEFGILIFQRFDAAVGIRDLAFYVVDFLVDIAAFLNERHVEHEEKTANPDNRHKGGQSGKIDEKGVVASAGGGRAFAPSASC